MNKHLLRALLALFLAANAASASAAAPPELVAELRPLVETGLASEDVGVQSWAVRAASLLGDNTMREPIVAALTNTNAPVRIAAAQALLGMQHRVSDAKAALVREVAEGDAAVRALVMNNILLHADPAVRVEVLRQALAAATDAAVRREITTHLAQRGEGAVHALLERVATIDDATERAIYLEPLAAAARPEGVAVARGLLASRDAARRLEGAELAFAINNVEARALLEPLIAGADAALAQRAGAHLARYGSAPALTQTVALALNPEQPEDLRMAALELVRDQGAQLVSWPQLQALLAEADRSPAFKTRVYEAAGATRDPAALAALRGLLDGLFADERLFGIQGYGYSGQSDAVAMMLDILNAPGDLAIRVAAAEALGHIRGDLAAEAAATALRTERVHDVKVALVRALGQTGSQSAAQAIANTFALQDDTIALTALDGLLLLGSSAVAPQVETAATTFRTPEVRWRATVVLTHLDPQLGRIRLLQALDRPPAGFLDDLAGLPEDVLNAVDDRLLAHADQSIREAALFRVMRRPDRGYAVLRPLANVATAPDVRRQAIAVVVAENRPEDAELFTQLASDTDRAIRLQALAALAQLGDPANDELLRGYLNHADVALRLIAVFGLLAPHQ